MMPSSLPVRSLCKDGSSVLHVAIELDRPAEMIKTLFKWAPEVDAVNNDVR